MRVDAWTDRFVEVLHEADGQRFRWGRNDCCQFAARMVGALTGRDPREVFPRYRTKAEALAIIEECGGMEALMRKALGEPLPSVRHAKRGDIVLADFGRGLQPAVCTGVTCCAPWRVGLEKRPVIATAHWAGAVLAWSV